MNEPVVTIPAAFAVAVNAVLVMLTQLDVLAGDLVPYVVSVVNGVAVLAGLLVARSKVTPTFRAEAAVVAAVAAAEERVAFRPRSKRTRS